jgi:chlorite dismutase
MSRVDLTHDITVQNKMDIALLKQEADLNYRHLSEKLDGLIKTVNEINQLIKR